MSEYIKKIHNIFSLKNDTNEYSYTILKNGLTVFFIKNDISFVETALLYVNVGANADPDDTLGLAHFLEHMLFMGSKKFPGSSLFQTEITKNNATTNAFTSSMSTQYYFTTSTNFLYLLEIFSNFFIEPLFDIKYVEKEVNAVNSEHNKNISSDGWKTNNISKQFFKDNKHKKFSTGTKKTLLQDNNINKLRDKLINFYKKYYSADKMVLFISMNKNNNYDNKIMSLFELVPNRTFYNQSNIMKFKKYKQSFELIKIQTNNDHFLNLSWILKNDNMYNNTNNIICYILNNIDNGLQKYLENTKYCILSYTYISNVFDKGSIISINIKLSESGIKKWEYIVYYVCAYIIFLSNNIDIFNIYFDEYRRKTLLYTHTLDNINGSDLCLLYADIYDTYKYEFSLLPIYNLLIGDLDKCKVFYHKCLKKMTLQKVKVTLTSPLVSIKPNKTDVHYNTKYEHRKIKIKELQINETFSVPEPNTYIQYQNIEPFNVIKTPYIRVPAKNIYIIQKNTFNTSSIYSIINIICTKHDIDTYICKYLFFSYITKLNEVLITKLQLAQYTFDIYNTNSGFNLVINGHNGKHKICDLFKKYIDLFFTAKHIDMDIYKKVYINFKNDIDNYLHTDSYKMVKHEFIQMVQPNKYTLKTLSKYIDKYAPENISKTFLNDTIKSISNGHISGVFSGSIKQEDIKPIIDTLEQYIVYSNDKQIDTIDIKTIKKIDINNNTHNKDYAIGYGIYIGNQKEVDNWEYEYLLTRILTTYISNNFFDLLRTEKQLGYIVYATTINVNTNDDPHIYIVFVVQSRTNNLYNIVEEYIINKFLATINNITQEEFIVNKKSLQTHLEEKPKNIQEECQYMSDIIQSTPEIFSSNNIDDIITNRMQRKNLLIENLNKLTLDDLNKFANKVHKHPHSVIEIQPKN